MSEHNPQALTDADLMPFGKFQGQPLGDVPDWYFRWFLKQTWCDEWPAVVEYANNIDDEGWD